jgi:uncharacterized protein YjbI with pentapeptide repeats
MPTVLGSKRRLQGHVQQGGVFTGGDLRSAQAFQSVWERVQFEGAKLSLGDFRASKWTACSLSDTGTWGANLSASTLHDVTFDNCDGEQMSFAGAIMKDVVFRKCRLAYASFAGASMDGVSFINCNLHGADLTPAIAEHVSYLGSNLWSAKTEFGCSFWNSTFDEETCNRFAAMLARVHPDKQTRATLIGIAGDNTYRAISRLMASAEADTPEF